MGCNLTTSQAGDLHRSLLSLQEENSSLRRLLALKHSGNYQECLVDFSLEQPAAKVSDRVSECATVAEFLDACHQCIGHLLRAQLRGSNLIRDAATATEALKGVRPPVASEEVSEELVTAAEQFRRDVVALLDSFVQGSLRASAVKQRVFVKHLSTIYETHAAERRKEAFYHWKYVEETDQAYARSVSFSSQDTSFSDMMTAEHSEIMAENPLIETLQIHRKINKKSLSPLVMFRFLEEVMDKKHDTDVKDLAEERLPRKMAEFLLEHLHRSFGIEKIAINYLAQLIPGMLKLYKEKHPYAVWYCRLFRLFHPVALPYPLALYLTRIRIEFHALIDKYDKIRISQGKKPSGLRSKTKGKEGLAIVETGGCAFLADVVEFIQQKFATDKTKGIALIEAIRPPKVSHRDYVIYWICHKIRKMGSTPESIFNMVDNDGSGVIDSQKFTQSIKSLDIWISDESIRALVSRLEETGGMTKAAFLEAVKLSVVNQLNQSELMVVWKSTFLDQLSEIYMKTSQEEAQRLAALFSHEIVSPEEFAAVVRDLAPHLPADIIEKLYEEAPSQGPVDIRSAVRVLLRYFIGCPGMSIFGIPELQSVQLERLTAAETLQKQRTKLLTTVKEIIPQEMLSPK